MNEETKTKKKGRKRKKIPSYFSIEVNEIRSIAMMMNDADFGKWVKQALDDLSTGCVRPETDERVRSLYEDTKAEMDERYEYKTEWYENKKAEQNSGDRKEQGKSKPQNQQPPKPPTQKEPKPGQNVYGRFENVFLTQDEYSELARMIGNVNELNNLIDSFGANLEDGSKTSNNHFATLIKWIDYRKNKAKEDEFSGTRYESVTEHNRRVSEKADREIRQMKEMGLI